MTSYVGETGTFSMMIMPHAMKTHSVNARESYHGGGSGHGHETVQHGGLGLSLGGC